jgi:hypothetical protein
MSPPQQQQPREPRIIYRSRLRTVRGAPLKAVILDNDETTGYYAALEFLIRRAKHAQMTFKEAIQFIRVNLEVSHSFRPGLPEFLREILRLRRTGLIDAIIMYTNMIPGETLLDSRGVPRTNAEILASVFDSIVGGKFFDGLIVRSDTTRPEKYMSFVTKMYNADANKMAGLLFFDDRPQYILVAPTVKRQDRPHIYGIREYTWWSAAALPRTMEREIYHLRCMY